MFEGSKANITEIVEFKFLLPFCISSRLNPCNIQDLQQLFIRYFSNHKINLSGMINYYRIKISNWSEFSYFSLCLEYFSFSKI